MNIYSVKDTVAKEFGPVFESKNDDVAKRQFKKLIESNPVEPKEFELYKVAAFDHDTGIFTYGLKPTLLCDGTEFDQKEFDFEVKE